MESMLDRPEQELVLVVDDTPDNLLLMRELLEEQYRVRTAGSGGRAAGSRRRAAPGPDPARCEHAGHGRLRSADGSRPIR